MGFLLLATAAPAAAYEQEIEQLASTLVAEIADAGKKTIAVVDFTDLQGNVTELGRFLAEEFSVAIAGAGRGFEVVDRTHLGSILREHKLSTTGLIDPQTARELGKIVGVEALVTGTMTPFGDSVRIAIKILDTESAKIIGSTTGNIPRTGAIEDLLRRGVGPLISAASVNSTALAPTASQQTVEVNEFEFALQKCSRSGDKLTCSFFVINKGEDEDLRIEWPSRTFDNLGNEYRISKLQFGESQKELGVNNFLSKLLVREVPVRAEATFVGLSEQASVLTLLEIRCNPRNRRSFSAQLRNIPIN
jgi:TolB-like protein